MPKVKTPRDFYKYSRRTQNRILQKRNLITDISSESENEDSSSIVGSIIDEQQDLNDYRLSDAPDSVSFIESRRRGRFSYSENESYSSSENENDKELSIPNSESDTVRDNHGLPYDVDLSQLYLRVDSSSSETLSENTTDCEESEEDVDEDIIDQPLYDGARITLKEHIMLIFVHCLRHGLTGVCMEDTLRLVELHCPRPNNCKKTLYQFRKYLKAYETPLTKQFYCKNCFLILGTDSTPCESCNDLPSKDDYFISFSLLHQLEKLFSRPDFRENLQYRFNRNKLNENNYESIFDGKVCKELDEILPNVEDLFLTWYTDGISIFKQSKFSVWPFFLVINNLPDEVRYKPENLIMVGMWFGFKKPLPNLFLNSLEQDIHQLTEGIDIEIENRGPVKVRCVIMSGTCDSPAKSLFLNMRQFNGNFGCPKCKLRGESVNRRWVYRYKRSLPLRTDEEANLLAIRATNSNSVIFGIKGMSILSLVVYKPIRTTGIDIMHGAFKGVAEQIIDLWTNKKFKEHDFSLTASLDLIDLRLNSLTPPLFVQRHPRSIGKDLSFWKTSEFKNWLCYYSIIILNDILPSAYLKNFESLICGIFLLNKTSISEDEIDFAEKLLHRFTKKFQCLYGVEHMSSNIHNLLHLPNVVRETGPLRTMSCFPLEDINGKLKKLVHSSNSAHLQICSSLSMLLKSFNLEDNLREDTEVFIHCKRLLSAKKQYKIGQQIGHSIYVVGALKRTVIDDDDTVQRVIEDKNYFKFNRLFKNNNLYTSEAYTREIKTNSRCVKYKINGDSFYCMIKYFLKVTDCDCMKNCECQGEYYAIIQNLRIVRNLLYYTLRRRESYIFQCVLSERIEAIQVNDLGNICFYINIKDRNTHFIAEPINMIEDE